MKGGALLLSPGFTPHPDPLPRERESGVARKKSQNLSAPLLTHPIIPCPASLEARIGDPGALGGRSASGCLESPPDQPGVAIDGTAAQSSTASPHRFRDGAGNGLEQISVCEVPPAPPTYTSIARHRQGTSHPSTAQTARRTRLGDTGVCPGTKKCPDLDQVGAVSG